MARLRTQRRARAGRARGFWLVAGIVGVLAATVYIASQATRQPSSGLASLDEGIRLNFGLSREPISRSLRLDLCSGETGQELVECAADEPAEAGRVEIESAVLETDLMNASSQMQFPTNQFTVTATNVGRTGLLVNVNANPNEPDDVPPGAYVGRVIIDRSDGSTIPLAVRAELTPKDGGVAWRAFLALLLGALGGTLLKWLDDSFSTLAALRRRQRRVEHYLQGYTSALPEGVRRRLRQVQMAIRSFDAEGIDTTLDEIVTNQDALIVFAGTVDVLETELGRQREMLEALGPDAFSYAVHSAIAVEEALLADVRIRMWPWDQAEELSAQLKKAQSRFRQLTAGMRRFASTRDESVRNLLDRIATQIVQDDLASLGESLDLNEEVQVPVLAHGGHVDGAAPQPLPSLPTSRTAPLAEVPERRSVGLWLLDNAWWLTLGVIAALVVFLGYQTQFLENLAFDGDITDYFALAAWALAIQVAGGTIIETVGKLRTPPSL
jgi:hypothetical protein